MLDLVRSGVGSHLFITPGSSLWSRFIGYNETTDIDHGSVKLASQSLDSRFIESGLRPINVVLISARSFGLNLIVHASPLLCLLLMS